MLEDLPRLRDEGGTHGTGSKSEAFRILKPKWAQQSHCLVKGPEEDEEVAEEEPTEKVQHDVAILRGLICWIAYCRVPPFFSALDRIGAAPGGTKKGACCGLATDACTDGDGGPLSFHFPESHPKGSAFAGLGTGRAFERGPNAAGQGAGLNLNKEGNKDIQNSKFKTYATV